MRRHPSLTRRALLQSGGALLIIGCDPSKTPVVSRDTGLDSGGETGLDSGGETGASWEPYVELSEDCSLPTEVRGLGPFYIEGAPARNNLNIYGREGTPIRLYVEVTDVNCAPIPGALVEIWHCGPDESYEMEDAELPYRTALIADADGRLWFETIEPPPYLDEVGLMRPHIHYQTTAEGFVILSSQTKFAHDPDLDDSLESPGVLVFTEVDGVLCSNYRIVLERIA